MTHLAIVRFLLLYVPYYVFWSPPFYFLLILKHFPTKNSAFSVACQIVSYSKKETLKAIFSKSHFQRNRLRSYTNGYLKK